MAILPATKTVEFKDYIRFLRYTWIDFFRNNLPELDGRVYTQYPRKEGSDLKMPCVVISPFNAVTFSTEGSQRYFKTKELFDDFDNDDPLMNEEIYKSQYHATWQFNLHSMNQDEINTYEGLIWNLLLDTWDYDLDIDRKARVLKIKDYTDDKHPVDTDMSLLFYPHNGDLDIVNMEQPSRESFQISIRINFMAELYFIRQRKAIKSTKLIYSIL